MTKRQQLGRERSMELESLELMGVFLGVFGLILVVSALIPDTWIGQIANLGTGVLLLCIGIWSFLKGRRHRQN